MYLVYIWQGRRLKWAVAAPLHLNPLARSRSISIPLEFQQGALKRDMVPTGALERYQPQFVSPGLQDLTRFLMNPLLLDL